mgnify:CR=1 FL=1
MFRKYPYLFRQFDDWETLAGGAAAGDLDWTYILSYGIQLAKNKIWGLNQYKQKSLEAKLVIFHRDLRGM